MYASTILATLLGASTVFAAPTWPQVNGERDAVSEYFNLLAEKIDAAKFLNSAPSCDLSKAQIPTGEFIYHDMHSFIHSHSRTHMQTLQKQPSLDPEQTALNSDVPLNAKT
jgi:hypothetical protein